MPARPSNRSRPPVRLISYRIAPGIVDAARTPAAVHPGPLRQRREASWRPPPRPPLRAVRAGDGDRDADLAVAAMVIARAFAEVIAGIRPLHHLAGRATPEVYDQLADAIPPAGSAWHRAQPALRVTVPVIQEPTLGVAEVCAVVFTGVHAQALALRLDRVRGRWRCTAVETTISPGQLRTRPARQPGTAA
jgi:hypothetical protein